MALTRVDSWKVLDVDVVLGAVLLLKVLKPWELVVGALLSGTVPNPLLLAVVLGAVLSVRLLNP